MCGAESHDYSRSIIRMMERRMPASSTRFWTILAIIGLPVLACLLGMGIGAHPLLTTALVGLAGGCAAWITTCLPIPATPQPATPPSPTAPLGKDDPKLRHDIRGIISPAMLVAEQLLLSQDPATKKAATTINDSLDRLTARLKQRNTG
ncbi:hypothetical protein GOB86_05925 [Acetobacter lambici]|uniref:Uncharacterized protein n=1 Tax=Acetobacter lambici TaxID=1332824 RepID=A0ABT1EYR4_9PROT|nr:hypothetical protein [Acetobacter lambici]MCP1242078.1 hypothetical protein [Acetobacter lambici]MCP1258094.1 hypothetical protein [Acetobacter lambici]NHO56607.1 hypothetical protein [Acetobacter lambici]